MQTYCRWAWLPCSFTDGFTWREPQFSESSNLHVIFLPRIAPFHLESLTWNTGKLLKSRWNDVLLWHSVLKGFEVDQASGISTCFRVEALKLSETWLHDTSCQAEISSACPDSQLPSEVMQRKSSCWNKFSCWMLPTIGPKSELADCLKERCRWVNVCRLASSDFVTACNLSASGPKPAWDSHRHLFWMLEPLRLLCMQKFLKCAKQIQVHGKA